MSESPIWVVGTGRSGTTWMQHALSEHADCHIHGQFPMLPWTFWRDTLDRLIKAGAGAGRQNERTQYTVPHYCGSPEPRCRAIVARLFKDFMCGYGDYAKPRWGVKAIGGFSDDEASLNWAEAIWPDARWIHCARNPFDTLQSHKRTFNRGVEPASLFNAWVHHFDILERRIPRERRVVFQIDRPHAPQMDAVLETAGLMPDAGVAAFVSLSKPIHRGPKQGYTIEPRERSLMADTVPCLRERMVSLGYSISA